MWEAIKKSPDVKRPAGLFCKRAMSPADVEAVRAEVDAKEIEETRIDACTDRVRQRRRDRADRMTPSLEAVEREAVDAFAGDADAGQVYANISRSLDLGHHYTDALHGLLAHPLIANLGNDRPRDFGPLDRLDRRAVAVLAATHRRSKCERAAGAQVATKPAPKDAEGDVDEIERLSRAAVAKWYDRAEEAGGAMEEIKKLAGDDFDGAVSVLAGNAMVRLGICKREELDDTRVSSESEMGLAIDEWITERLNAMSEVRDLLGIAENPNDPALSPGQPVVD
jgi:hypothetical protein